MAGRVSQTATEAVSQADDPVARMSQVAVEAVSQTQTATALVSQVAVELLIPALRPFVPQIIRRRF